MFRFAIISFSLLTAFPACRDQSVLKVVTGETETTIYAGEKPVLSYVHAETLPPEGINPLYKRSAYIHPLCSPGGEILTRIQPPDHYHHYGIWNPWTKTRFDTMHVDFWNLGEGEGTLGPGAGGRRHPPCRTLRTMERMVCRMCSGSSGQAVTTAARSGCFS